MRKTNKYEWSKQYIANRVKCNEINNTAVSNRERVRVREKAIANTRNLFWDSSNSLYVPAFTAWRIFTIHQWSPQKTIMFFKRSGVYNSNLQSSTQVIAQSQWNLLALGGHKDHKSSLYNFLEYRMRNEAQKSLCERKFSLEEWIWELKTCRNLFEIENTWNLGIFSLNKIWFSWINL